MLAKPATTTTITIEATFGSDFQKGPAMRVLKQMIGAWGSLVREKHKAGQTCCLRRTMSLDQAIRDPEESC